MPLSYENVKKLKEKSDDIIGVKATIATIKAMRGDLNDRSVTLHLLPISLRIGAHNIGFKKEDGAELIKLLDYTQQKMETKAETLKNEMLEILREAERNHEEDETA